MVRQRLRGDPDSAGCDVHVDLGRICAVFVPAVLACSALTLAGWLLAGSAAGHAVSAALAVLIIACPCAPFHHRGEVVRRLVRPS